MCQAVQEMCDDARAEGHQEQAMLTAHRMLQDPRFSPEDISRFSGLSLEDVLKLQKKQFVLKMFRSFAGNLSILLFYNTNSKVSSTHDQKVSRIGRDAS